MLKASANPGELEQAAQSAPYLKHVLAAAGIGELTSDQAYGMVLGLSIAHDLSAETGIEKDGEVVKAMVVPISLVQAMISLGISQFREAESRDATPLPGFYL